MRAGKLACNAAWRPFNVRKELILKTQEHHTPPLGGSCVTASCLLPFRKSSKADHVKTRSSLLDFEPLA